MIKMATKKEMKNFKGVELTETLFDVVSATKVIQEETGKPVSADQIVEYFANTEKTYTKKSIVASLARLDTTCGLLKKNEPIKVTTYEIKKED